uniref:Uncharacterized protein n=1 Tax=Lepisosteus oculatus TaxID=7918 RepID=W5M3Q0_LEPOC
ARISKAGQLLGCLRSRVMKHRKSKLLTQIKVFEAAVLLYGCETWMLYLKHFKQLERLRMRSLRLIMSIKWQDSVTNLEVLDRAGLVSTEAMIVKAQLRLTGHVIRMNSSRMPRQIHYGVLAQGRRNLGRPKKFKGCIKENLKQCGISAKELEPRAQDRTFQQMRNVSPAPEKTQEGLGIGSCSSCRSCHSGAPHCPPECVSRMGLTSHIRAHQR